MSNKRPASPSSNNNDDDNNRTNKLTDFDKRLLTALDVRDTELQKQKEERQKLMFTPLEKPSEDYIQNVIIPGIQRSIVKSMESGKNIFQVEIATKPKGSHIRFVLETLSREDFPWCVTNQDWVFLCFKWSTKETEHSVNEHITAGGLTYLRYIVEVWNQLHTAAQMSLLEGNDGFRISYILQVEIKTL